MAKRILVPLDEAVPAESMVEGDRRAGAEYRRHSTAAARRAGTGECL
jgi:hypothetical protein